MTWLPKRLLLLAVALVIPACGTTSDKPARFSDDFNRVTLGTDYTLDSGSIVLDPAVGNPLPSVQFPLTSGAISTVKSYANRGLTFSVDFSVDTATGSAVFSVSDVFSAWVVTATMTNGMVTFYLETTDAFAFTWAAGEFHTISFESTPAGVMSWKLDGVTKVTAGAVWLPTLLRLSFSGTDAHADNVSVLSN